MSLYINEASQKLLDATFKAEPQSILLAGPVGIGLATITESYAKQMGRVIRKVLPAKDDVIDLEKGTITVESIRKLYDETRLFEPKGRVVIIDYAERMAAPAQNAFLKLLEEPSKGTMFILLTHTPERLLPTITSRAQRLDLRPISSKQSEQLLDELNIKDTVLRSQLFFVATGLPAELTRLATNSELFAARAAIIRDARDYAQGRAYQRLLLAKKYKDSRKDALLLLEDAMKMLQNGLNREQDEQLLRLLGQFEQIHKRVTEQGNIRLQLSAGAGVA